MGNENLNQQLATAGKIRPTQSCNVMQCHAIGKTGLGVAVDRISCRNLPLPEKNSKILDENFDFSPFFVRPSESIEAARRKKPGLFPDF